MSDPIDDPFDRLVERLLRTDAEGNRVHSNDDVRHALPALALWAGLDLETLSPGMQELIGEKMQEAGLDLANLPEGDQAIEAMAALYQEHPIAAGILTELERAFGAQAPEAGRHAQALLGRAPTSGVLGGGERPAGTVPGGAMSRLAAFPPEDLAKKS
jgi:hypothetical protein